MNIAALSQTVDAYFWWTVEYTVDSGHNAVNLNTSVPGRCGSNFVHIIFELIAQNNSLGTGNEIALKWVPENLTNEMSNIGSGNSLVPSGSKPWPEAMLNEIWAEISVTINVTGPQWVNLVK